jgi:3-hydroxyisobutyrate dehydrogenase-like beta-hydroxyacid dehydrogenase
MGPSGNGASSKLAVNALLGIGVQAVAEALMLGTRLGLDKSRLIDLISDTVVVSPSQKTKLQNARTGEYAPAFPLRLMNKDLGLIMAAASATSTPMPVVAIAHQISKTGVARGRGDEDMSVVIKIMEELLNP